MFVCWSINNRVRRSAHPKKRGFMFNKHRQALDSARRGEWDEAHKLVQDHSDDLSCLIHAYLHREEGDMGNARYWYGRAGSDMPDNNLADELERLYQMAEGESNA